MEIKANEEIRVSFPFYRGIHQKADEEGFFDVEVWIPGCRSEYVYPDDTELVADGIGEMVLKIVDVHKPGKYPERVFYTRRWADPDGKEFGVGKLHITTTTAFKRRAKGYYHNYRVAAGNE